MKNRQAFTRCDITRPSNLTYGVMVIGKTKERWQELCELASKEQDPAKLMELMKEIDRLLANKLNRLKGAPPPK
jgi:hypothetical protein